MCRFTLYLGPAITLSALLTEPEHSLIHQSFQSKEREEPLNGDGFGIAWYPAHLTTDAVAFRSVSPAWSNRNLLDLARAVESSCILAHVRAATQGLSVSELNCHPFCAADLAFMHNGDVGRFDRVRRPLLGLLSDETFSSIGGSTDSEHMFALFRDQLRALNTSEDGSAASTSGDAVRLAAALRATIRKTLELVAQVAPGEPSYLNIAVSDGHSAVVCRVTTDHSCPPLSLYYSAGHSYVCEDGVCRMLPPAPGQHAVIVSSEPLSRDQIWTEVPANHLLLISPDRAVRVEAV